jgi:hypothetical protein
MLERPHLTRLLGAASVIAALALLFHVVAAITLVMATDRVSTGTTGPNASRSPGDAHVPRGAAIRATIRSLREECQRSSGGDWDRWVEQLGPFRASLYARICDAKPYNPKAEGTFEARSRVLEGRGDFDLFESSPENYLRHLYDLEWLKTFRDRRPVVAAARWLKSLGIDVIFVPVPKMTEVYAEHFADHCPSDRIVAPQVRRIVLELLESDVEVVDLLPAFLEASDKDPAPLFQPADPHWAPRAWAIAAEAIGERLKRYPFVAKALEGPRICQSVEQPYPPASKGATYLGLSPDQQRRAEAVQPRTFQTVQNSIRSIDDRASPLIVIGDSYNGGLWECLIREINLPIGNLSGGGQTTEAFNDFLRDSESLKHCKVVVWLVCNSNLGDWALPERIRKFGDGSANATGGEFP